MALNRTKLAHYLLILGLFWLMLTLFGPVLKIPLASDDYIWVRDVAVFDSFGDFFRANFALKAVDFRYRPLMPTVVRLCYQISGPEPFCMHLAGLTLQFLNTLLVGSLAYIITKNNRAAWAGMFFFLVYFAHVETVAWISDLGNLLVGFFMLITVILFLLFIRRNNYFWGGLSLCTFTLAMISKESALALGPILISWAGVIYWKSPQVYQRRLILTACAGYILLGGIYLFFINKTGLNFAFSGTGNYTFHLNLVTLRNALSYPLNFIWPTNYTAMEIAYQHIYAISLGYVGITSDFLSKIMAIPGIFWIVGGSLTLWLGTIWLLWRGQLITWLALSWVILGILPVIFIGGYSDRHTYVASIGLSLLVGHLFFGKITLSSAKTHPLKFSLATLLFGMALAFNIYWTQIRVQNWQVAGSTAARIIAAVITRYPNLSGDSELWFVGLPDNFNGAYIFRLGIDAALQLKINDTRLVAHSLGGGDEAPKPLLPHQYAFVYQDGQLLDLTPAYRAE